MRPSRGSALLAYPSLQSITKQEEKKKSLQWDSQIKTCQENIPARHLRVAAAECKADAQTGNRGGEKTANELLHSFFSLPGLLRTGWGRKSKFSWTSSPSLYKPGTWACCFAWCSCTNSPKRPAGEQSSWKRGEELGA